uniref:Uncharacterized protein n=1 Tax=Parastrongyloides trichosuri TaxID=131310 RepID=A0A0N5A5F7_PARTI
MQSENFIKNNFVTPTNSTVKDNELTNSGKAYDVPNTSNIQDDIKFPKKANIPSTPAIIKARRIHEEFNIQSPSDNMLSPCTKKLFGNKPRSKKISASHPINILRMKQQESMYNQKKE